MESARFKSVVHALQPLKMAACGVVVGALFLTACSGASSQPEVAPGAANLPQYDPGESALFGDSFSQDFFGLDRKDPPKDDEKLLARTQRADSVVPVRISTVTRDSDGQRVVYQLVMTPVAAPMAGEPIREPVTLDVGATSPAYAWIQSLGDELVGRTGILFAKRYNHDGAITLHWHVEADTPEVRTAIERGRLVSEVGA